MRYEKITTEEAMSYRIPMQVVRILVLRNNTSYPVCPRCNITLDREYMNFCDRCGQKLSWKNFSHAALSFIQ